MLAGEGLQGREPKGFAVRLSLCWRSGGCCLQPLVAVAQAQLLRACFEVASGVEPLRRILSFEGFVEELAVSPV